MQLRRASLLWPVLAIALSIGCNKPQRVSADSIPDQWSAQLNGPAQLVTSPAGSAYFGRRWVKQRITVPNASGRELYTVGYSANEPFIQVFLEHPESNQWESRGLGYCGNGAKVHKLDPSGSLDITVNIPYERRGRRFKVQFTLFLSSLRPEGGKRVTTEALSIPSTGDG